MIANRVIVTLVLLPLLVLMGSCGKKPERAKTVESKPTVEEHQVKSGTKAGEKTTNPIDGAVMVWIPSGEFRMGTSDEELNSSVMSRHPDWIPTFYDLEKPQHTVNVDGFWMYKYEVTVKQYRAFCRATNQMMPSAPEWGWKDDHPIVDVTWQQAMDYAKWAGGTLPTEAQWEKGARGTDARIYPWGNSWDKTRCANSAGKHMQATRPVGSYPNGAGPYGTMDMAGNAWEWCYDWAENNYYSTSPHDNPTGPASPTQVIMGKVVARRAMRGGSWYNDDAGYFRCSAREGGEPEITDNTSGFRCVVVP